MSDHAKHSLKQGHETMLAADHDIFITWSDGINPQAILIVQ